MNQPHPTPVWWDAASASVPYMGMQTNGDRAYLDLEPGRCRLGLIDAAGHGPPASEVCDQIEHSDILHTHPTPQAALIALHELLRGTVGAAALIADIYPEAGHARVSYAGVGNVRLWRGRHNPTHHEGQPGMLGSRMPQTLRPHEVTLSDGDLLMLTTDGVRSGARALLPRTYLSAIAMAHAAVHDHARPYDDATCVVFFYQPTISTQTHHAPGPRA